MFPHSRGGRKSLCSSAFKGVSKGVEICPVLNTGHPEDRKEARFRLEFLPMKIGAGMTPFMEAEPPLPSEGED
jgi:hypothetical protein